MSWKISVLRISENHDQFLCTLGRIFEYTHQEVQTSSLQLYLKNNLFIDVFQSFCFAYGLWFSKKGKFIVLPQFPSPQKNKQGRGVLVFEILTKRGVMKKLFRNRVLVEREGALRKSGVTKLFHQFSFRKACFHYYWNFFCLVNIHTCNQQIYSFMWFSFYQKMIYYEISFPLTLMFNYNFVKISLLMTFISISISLKT